MTNSAIIFIGSPERHSKNAIQTCKQLFYVTPTELFFRIFAGFVPPISKKYQKVYVDFQGPLLAILILIGFLNYGYLYKSTNSFRSPTEVVLIYAVLMPILSFIVCKLANSCITLSEVTCLIGYALYGHVLTLLVSFLCYKERSNFFFFVCLIFFGGLSTLRVALVLLGTIAVPAARLLVCSFVSVVNILFVIFLHFAYMHTTFTYNRV